MVLNTLVWKGSAKRPEDEVTVQSKVVDIFHEEQLSEDYLCNINDHGQASSPHIPFGYGVCSC